MAFDLLSRGTLANRITEQPAWWKRLLRKAIHRQVAWHRLSHEWNRWHQQMIPVLQQVGLSLGSAVTAPLGQFYCLQCKKVFAKKSFLAVHAFKKHQRISRARYYVEGKQCSCCLKTYDMHTDLINHVNRQERCFEFYSQRGEFVEAQPAVNSRSENRARRTLRDPVLQAEGPRPPLQCGGIDRQMEEKQNLFQAWKQALLYPADGSPLLERLRIATLDTVLFHDEILTVFTEWLNLPETEESITVAQAAEASLFFVHASASWFLKQQTCTTETAETAQRFFEREAWRLDVIRCPVPKPIPYYPKVYAHLFSGTRRAGDVQEAIEQLGGVAVSIDIIFDIDWGNLLKESTFQLFARAIRERVLAGFVAGPPCETWSRARSVDNGGPRPLRTRIFPVGLPHLTRREMAQVSVGNQLLGVALCLFLHALIWGATAILEHPACPDDEPTFPSIWRLPVVDFLLRFETCTKLRIWQGLFGGISPKPTDLLIANGGPRVAELFVQGRTTPMPRGGQIGRNKDGSWKTSVLKQYPRGLCQTMAQVLFDAQSQADVLEPLPDWFCTAITNLVATYDHEARMGPDWEHRAADQCMFNS